MFKIYFRYLVCTNETKSTYHSDGDKDDMSGIISFKLNIQLSIMKQKLIILNQKWFELDLKKQNSWKFKVSYKK